MSTRRRIRVWMLPGGYGGILFLSACFVLGSVLGAFFVAHLGSGGDSAVSHYLNEWAAALQGQQNADVPWFTDLLYHLRFPVAVFLLGFVPLGVFVIPAAFMLRGTLISFAVASMLKMYAYKGGAAAFLLYGPAEIAEVAALFLIGETAFRWSYMLSQGRVNARQRRPSPVSRSVVSCVMMLFAISLAQSAVRPWLMAAIGQLIG